MRMALVKRASAPSRHALNIKADALADIVAVFRLRKNVSLQFGDESLSESNRSRREIVAGHHAQADIQPVRS